MDANIYSYKEENNIFLIKRQSKHFNLPNNNYELLVSKKF
ncbi:hypothetical protein PEPS_44240 (plasmid) [Persicobacter psychrovividus]|uniref:Uncharacterized protein n=1 Tax=Persicobacter psychrovividus TaxID=387638 RepID=A0ABN6LKN1_9BACT|nr:hypothetical protein PEPS_44240 [Persicobacter psychrovividus]